MSDKLHIAMTMEMNDRVSPRTARISNSIQRMSKTSQSAMNALRRSSDLAYKGLDKLGNRYTGFLTGAGGAAAVRSVAQMETRLTRLGIQANKTKDQIEELRKKVIETAQMEDIRLNPDQLLDAIDKIVEKTGDLDLAQDNLRNIGLAVQSSGAAGGDIGALVADLKEKFNIEDASDLFGSLDLLVNQGKAGAFTLQNMAAQGERVTAAYAVTGRVMKPAVREMGAMLQVIRKGTGSSEQAATAFEALMRTLSDAKKRKLLESGGVRISDPEDPKRMRAITDIVKDLIRATGGDSVKLSKIFDAEAMRALNVLSAEFSKTGSFASLDNFLNQASDGSALLKDAFTASDRSAAKWQTVITALENGVFTNLNKPVSAGADLIGNIKPSTMDSGIGYAMGGAALLGGLALGVKGHKLMKGMRGRKSGIGSAVAGIAAGGMGVQPVLVTNWPLSMGVAGGQLSGSFGKVSGKAARAAKSVGKIGKVARLGKGAMKRLPYVGAGIAAIDIGSAALSGSKTAMGESVGSLGGSLAGAAAGAAIGSVVPLVGTAIGAAIGGVVGSFGGGALGKWITGDKSELSGEIKIKVDSEGRPSVSADMGRGINSNVSQGIITGGGL